MKQTLLIPSLFMVVLSSFGQSANIYPNVDLQTMVNALSEDAFCSSITNISSNNNAGLHNQGFESMAVYSVQNEPNFPFESGLVLSTENVNLVADDTQQDSGNSNWPGDPDIEALIQNQQVSYNASVFEFDFVPYQEQLSVDYIFASDEYAPDSSWWCNYPDTFAFIVSGPGIADVNAYNHDANPNTPDVYLDLGGLNIATFSGTNIPVNPTNAHPYDNCSQGTMGEYAIPQIFDSVNSNNSIMDYEGQTVPLTATVDLIPGQTYHIKLVIGDSRDAIFDSSMFMDANSFKIGYVPENLPFDPDFSDFELPDCWNETDAADYLITNNCSSNGENYLQLNGGNYAVDTAPVDTQMVPAIEVQFDVLTDCNDQAAAGDNLELEYFDGSNWNLLDTIDPMDLPSTQSSNSSNNWTNFNYVFSDGLSQNFKIRFKRQGGANGQDDINIANFEIVSTNYCPMPNNISLADVTTSSADFSIDAVDNYTGSYDYVIVNENDDPVNDPAVQSGNIPSTQQTITVEQLVEDETYDFYLISTCDSSVSSPITFTTTTLASRTFALEQVKVYPNPASNRIFINNTKASMIDQVGVFDMNGKLVKELKVDDDQVNEYNIGEISSGVYFIKLRSGQAEITKKLIIK